MPITFGTMRYTAPFLVRVFPAVIIAIAFFADMATTPAPNSSLTALVTASGSSLLSLPPLPGMHITPECGTMAARSTKSLSVKSDELCSVGIVSDIWTKGAPTEWIWKCSGIPKGNDRICRAPLEPTANRYPGCEVGDIQVPNGPVWAACNAGWIFAYSDATKKLLDPILNASFNLAQPDIARPWYRSIAGESFQWGRNDPLSFSATSTALSLTTSADLQDNTGTAIYDPQYPKDWKAKPDPSLWGGKNTSVAYGNFANAGNPTMRGPCAAGYHVPTVKEWIDTAESFGFALSENPPLSAWTDFSGILGKFLMVPFLESYSVSQNQMSSHLGNLASFWTSTPEPSETNGLRSYAVSFLNGQIILTLDNRSEAKSVRCIRN